MTRLYDIGPFRLDAASGALTRNGTPVGLGSRAVAVLTVLVERPQEFVPKGRIIDAAWPGVVVEESNLPVQIAAIRRVLAQTPGGERWIETLIGRGYRFVGPVTEVADHRHAGPSNKRSNLPEALTSFIGRERELVEIKRLLPGKRLVTIVGIGGIGKTRLALQTAAEVVDAYRDGVWLVELGSIRDALLVTTSVAQVLGVEVRAGNPPIESLRAHLKSRQVLLVLDNCEHLLDACARLADAVLGEAKDATIIATSREPLRVAGEQIYPLQPLSLPEQVASAGTMERSEAVQLFVDRVQRQLPDFELTPARAPAVAEVCIHLDGIPLALELAAARARSLSVEQINARLGDRFRLLTGGSRTALPRQQTLRATLDWSYDLLAEDERTVLQRLSIFPASFTVEAASAVASDAAIDEFAVIDLLSQLVTRSLVVADTSGAGTRYRLLETTRAYAAEMLEEARDTEACKRSHAQYFGTLLDRALDEWFWMPDADWLARYAPELANIRAALDWALGTDGDSAIGITLAGASGALWVQLGLFDEGAQRLEAATHSQGDVSESDQARLWLWLGRLLDQEPLRGLPALERAVALYRRIGDPVSLGFSLVRMGRVLAFMGMFEQSEATLTEARPLLAHAPPRLFNFYLFNLAFLKSQSGDPVAARKYYEQSLAICRQMGYDLLVLSTLGNLANVAWLLGDLDAAESAFRQQVALLRASPVATNRLLGWAIASLGGVLAELGQLDEALVATREGLPLLREDGSAWIFAHCSGLLAGLAGKLFDAARLAGYAEHTFVAKQAARHPIDMRQRKRLDELLRDKLAPDELERLLAEGAKLSDDEACRLALEE